MRTSAQIRGSNDGLASCVMQTMCHRPVPHRVEPATSYIVTRRLGMAVEQATRFGRSFDTEMLAKLQGVFRGDLLLPDDGGYDDARKVWNSMIEKHPALIARCTGTADVVAAVEFARSNGIELAVKGGGHNVAGNAVIDDGLMIDLFADERCIQVDPAAENSGSRHRPVLRGVISITGDTTSRSVDSRRVSRFDQPVLPASRLPEAWRSPGANGASRATT